MKTILIATTILLGLNLRILADENNSIEVQIANISHTSLVDFDTHKFDMMEFSSGPVAVFCIFNAHEDFIQPIVSKYGEVKSSRGNFNDSVIIARISRNGEQVLTLNAYSQILDESGNVYYLNDRISAYIEGYLTGAAKTATCMEYK